MEYLLREQHDYDFTKADCYVTVSEKEGRARLSVDSHWHDLYEIVQCSGCGTLLLEGQTYSYRKNDIVFTPCGFLHGYSETVTGDYVIYMICAENLLSRSDSEANDIAEEILFGKIAYPYILSENHPAFGKICGILKNLREALENGRQLAARAMLFSVFAEIPFDREKTVRQNAQRHDIREVISYIENNYMTEITLEQLSRKAAMSKYYFLKTFKRYCGLSPMQFVLNYRLNRAMKSLMQGRSVTEAAFACGFANLSYFTKKFKEKFFVLPKDVKMQNSRNRDFQSAP